MTDGDMPERRLDPPEEDWSDDRHPALATCECGKPAWWFPKPGERYCGFCPASEGARKR